MRNQLILFLIVATAISAGNLLGKFTFEKYIKKIIDNERSKKCKNHKNYFD